MDWRNYPAKIRVTDRRAIPLTLRFYQLTKMAESCHENRHSSPMREPRPAGNLLVEIEHPISSLLFVKLSSAPLLVVACCTPKNRLRRSRRLTRVGLRIGASVEIQRRRVDLLDFPSQVAHSRVGSSRPNTHSARGGFPFPAPIFLPFEVPPRQVYCRM